MPAAAAEQRVPLMPPAAPAPAPAALKTLDQALDALDWDPAVRGPLLIVAPASVRRTPAVGLRPGMLAVGGRAPEAEPPQRGAKGYSLTALDSNKPISLRLAHFAQFKAGRLLSIRVLVDTFDLVEQALGRPIHLPRIAS